MDASIKPFSGPDCLPSWKDVKLNCGIVSLHPLYDYVKSNPDSKCLDLRSPVRRRYRSMAASICEQIQTVQGFYLWGRYEPNRLWQNIYLGKAGFGITAHLRTRILEELRDESACIWHAVFSEAELRKAGERNHPKMWGKYQFHMKRALMKTGTTHIVWVAVPGLSNPDVRDIESDLIETLNPRANASRPIPPVALQDHTKEIIGEFRRLIHAHRDTGYTIADLDNCRY
jgi:hypothetical protein